MTIGTRRGRFETLGGAALSLALLATSPAGAAPDPAAQCEASKLKAAGKRANCLTIQQSKTLLGRAGDPTKCDASFAKGFQKAEDRGGSACPTTGDADAVNDLVDACVGGVAAALGGSAPPPPPSCPTFPGTGQTTPFTAERNDGVPQPVTVPDDGTLRVGTLAYTDNGDGTITDDNTGLTWEKKSDDGGLHDVHNSFLWSGNGSQETIWDWLDDVNAEGGTGFAGHDDWRIPNVKEMMSIVRYEGFFLMADPAFNTGCTPGCTVTSCSCTVPSDYATSTSFGGDETFAFVVEFLGGLVLVDEKSFPNSVRAVRGGL
jgi:hypothetical protein